jgi:hypothetical protein
MDEVPPVLPVQPELAPPPRTSLLARLLNVFATPGAVFDEVKASPALVFNWLIPMLLAAVIGSVSAHLTFSQPTIRKQVLDLQSKQFDHLVTAGTMTRADADNMLTIFQKLMLPVATVGSAATGLLRAFWWAFLLWLLGRALLKVQLSYHKALEVAGLALLVAILGDVVTLLMTLDLPQLFNASQPRLTLMDADSVRKSKVVMGVFNVFTFWFIGVMSVGLAKLANIAIFRAAWLISACWMIQTFVLLSIGLGQFSK